MVKIEAVIKPFKLSDVQEALLAIGVQGMTVLEVKGFGRQKGHVELYRGAEYRVDYVPKLMIIIVVQDAMAEEAINAISKAAHTGKIGDGKLFISNVSEVMRIRTKEVGAEAI
ncbi:MAG: P-II family nitrogen regulator [Syntrophobacteraceae bacterium]